ncbi:hypothetical protein [Amycolatopsis sp. NPDC004378]
MSSARVEGGAGSDRARRATEAAERVRRRRDASKDLIDRTERLIEGSEQRIERSPRLPPE